MKIAILASGFGEKALHLYDFFKEGNRVEIITLLTDDSASEVAVRFARQGIPVEVVTGMDEAALSDMVENLRRNDVELLVVDGFDGEIPSPIAEGFGEAISYPSGVSEAPLEIIETVKRLKQSETETRQTRSREVEPAKAQTPKSESERSDSESGLPSVSSQQDTTSQTTPPSLEDEWARALNVNPPAMQEDEGSRKQPPQIPQTPVNTQPSTGSIPPSPGNGPQSSVPPQVPTEKMPDTYLIWSVLATVLCCLIPGIVAIVFSSSVSSKYYSGDIEGAKRASRNAQIWVIVSVVTGIIWGTLYLPLSLMVG